MRSLTIILLLQVYSLAVSAQPDVAMAKIKGGSFTPSFGKDSLQVRIDDFLIDKYPVTNRQYNEFVTKYPSWKRSNVKKIFADQSYLRHWNSDVQFSPDIDDSPVTHVSWYAAKAYCECMGKRLPTADEWDYLSLASETKPNGSDDKDFNQYILDWYARPNPAKLPSVKSTFRNYYGVYGIHGLVWEWVLDFNSAMMSGDSRNNAGPDNDLVCGNGSELARDRENYVAFMRYAFRSSLKANYTVSNLGFRCAKSPIQ